MPDNPWDEFSQTPTAGKNDSWDEFRRVTPEATPLSWGDVARDVGRQILAAPVAGAEALVTGPAQLMGLAGRGLEAIGFKGDPERAAEQQRIRELAQQQGGAGGISQYLPQPKTEPGKYTRAIGEMAVAGAAQPGSLLRRGIEGAVAGAGSEAAGELAEKAELPPWMQAGARMAGAVAAPAAATRLITPIATKAGRAASVRTLENEGVDLTAGQRTGNRPLQYSEASLSPGAADQFVSRQQEQFTRAALRRIGTDADRATPEVMDDAFNRIGGEFDRLTQRTGSVLRQDQRLTNDLGAAELQYNRLVAPNQRVPAIRNTLDDITNVFAANNGVIPADVYQQLRSDLGRDARRLRNDQNAQHAMYEIQGALDTAMGRNIPQAEREAWQQARRQYRDLLVLARAVGYAGPAAAEGIITPANLGRATTAIQGMRNYVRGQGAFTGLARAGRHVMAPLPSSGTSERIRAHAVPAAIASGAGALLGGATPIGPIAGAVAGLAVPSIAGRALLSSPVRGYLSNRLLPPAIGPYRAAAIRAAIAGGAGGATQYPPFQAGGDVPARGYARGRPAAKEAPTGKGRVRARPGQALQDGGEAREQQAGEMNPWVSEYVPYIDRESMRGHVDPRSQRILGRKTGDFGPDAWDAWGLVENYFRPWRVEPRLQEGGEVEPPKPHARLAAMFQGSPGSRGFMGGMTPLKTKAPQPLTRYDVAQQLAGAGVPYSDWAEKRPAFQEGGAVNDDSRDEPQQVQDAAEAAAARVQRRYPTRPPDPLSLAASKVTWSQFLPSEERALAAAGALQRGEDYDPRDVFLSTVGAVGSPAAGLTREAATLGAGAVRRVAAAAPEVRVGLTAAERAAPLPGAPYSQYAEEYPAIGPGTPTPKTKPKYPGETYLKKTLTPEAEEFTSAREKVMKEMKQGYRPYYDPAERFAVDPSKYPGRNIDTLTLQPAKQETIDKYMEQIGAPATRAALRQAYKRGLQLGNANDWYFMGQLEKSFIDELGPQAGREAFLQRFATPMAATTSGNQPTANLLLAHYLNYLRNRGLPMPAGAYETPATVGGRYAMTNVRDYQNIMSRGGYQALGEDQPKMHNFARSFIGDLLRAVMDEQMAEGMLAHAGKKSLADPARKTAYGLLERPLHQEAKRVGVEPGAFQDVAWAGFKNEPGKPMIEHVNDAIERTHRLTGMPRDEIVRRGLIRGEIPIYTTGAVPLPGLQQEQQ